MNEIARLRASAAFAIRTPAHFAYTGQHISDGLAARHDGEYRCERPA